MKNTGKLQNTLQIAFLIIGVLTALEFIFVKGLFTWLIAVGATAIVGLANVFMALKNKEWIQACFYLLLIVALCMGYMELV